MKTKTLLYILLFLVVELLVLLIYPSVKASAYAFRGYEAVGGEMFLWLLPFAAVYAVSEVSYVLKNREDKR